MKINCQNCGQTNESSGNFCRYCGFRLTQLQPQKKPDYEQAHRRPYSWKTDEFEVRKGSARNTEQMPGTQPRSSDLAPRQTSGIGQTQNEMISAGYRCPRCSSQSLPVIERKISTAGWIVFAVLLLTFFPLFWIGFLIKEDIRLCPVCNLRID